MTQSNNNWSQLSLQSSTLANGKSENNSSESTSSSETLKWLGSMSDISVFSQATNSSVMSGSGHYNIYFFILIHSF